MEPKAAGGIRWHWTPQLWRWNPTHGPWRPEYGGPKTAAYLEVSTAGMHGRASYDFWCESAFYNFHPDPWSARATDAFHARVNGWCSTRGSVFAYESGPIAGKSARGAHVGGDLDVGLVLEGTRFYQPSRGSDFTAARGDFFVYDPGRPCRVRWTNHKGVHVTVRRTDVEKAFNGRIIEPKDISRALTVSPLAPFLRNHLTLMAQTMHRLSAPEQSLLTGQLIDLLLTTLRVVSNDAALQSPTDQRALHVAAKSYIEAHLSEPNLRIDDVARAVGCSRSTLYRAFAAHGETVSDYIRERRLHWLWRLIHDAPARLTITDLALQCGFDNVGYVSKLFRRHFGITPREARIEARRRRPVKL